MPQTLDALRSHRNRIHRLPENPLEERVVSGLCSSPYRYLQGVRCHCKGGAVVLVGSLPSYFMKQMAQETVRRIIGVTEIDNRVEVIYAEEYAR